MTLPVWPSYDPTTFVMLEGIAAIRKENPTEVLSFLKDRNVIPSAMYKGKSLPNGLLFNRKEVVETYKVSTRPSDAFPIWDTYDSQEFNTVKHFAEKHKVASSYLVALIREKNFLPVARVEIAGEQGRPYLYRTEDIDSVFSSIISLEEIKRRLVAIGFDKPPEDALSLLNIKPCRTVKGKKEYNKEDVDKIIKIISGFIQPVQP